MTHSAKQLSENGKLIAICLMFPLFWPFLPVLLLCMGIEKIQHAYWAWKARSTKANGT